MTFSHKMSDISLEELNLECLPSPDDYVLDADHADPNHPHFPRQLDAQIGQHTGKWTRKEMILAIVGAVIFIATLVVGFVIGIKVIGANSTTLSIEWHTVTSTVTPTPSPSSKPSEDNSGRPVGMDSAYKSCAEFGNYTVEALCNSWCKAKLPQGQEQVCMEITGTKFWNCKACDVTKIVDRNLNISLS
jgi:hypothetical protein